MAQSKGGEAGEEGDEDDCGFQAGGQSSLADEERPSPPRGAGAGAAAGSSAMEEDSPNAPAESVSLSWQTVASLQADPSSDDVAVGLIRAVRAAVPPPDNPTVKVAHDPSNPLSNYGQMDRINVGAFPCLFPLGTGFPSKGPMSAEDARHLMEQADQLHARHMLWLSYNLCRLPGNRHATSAGIPKFAVIFKVAQRAKQRSTHCASSPWPPPSSRTAR